MSNSWVSNVRIPWFPMSNPLVYNVESPGFQCRIPVFPMSFPVVSNVKHPMDSKFVPPGDQCSWFPSNIYSHGLWCWILGFPMLIVMVYSVKSRGFKYLIPLFSMSNSWIQMSIPGFSKSNPWVSNVESPGFQCWFNVKFRATHGLNSNASAKQVSFSI